MSFGCHWLDSIHDRETLCLGCCYIFDDCCVNRKCGNSGWPIRWKSGLVKNSLLATMIFTMKSSLMSAPNTKKDLSVINIEPSEKQIASPKQTNAREEKQEEEDKKSWPWSANVPSCFTYLGVSLSSSSPVPDSVTIAITFCLFRNSLPREQRWFTMKLFSRLFPSIAKRLDDVTMINIGANDYSYMLHDAVNNQFSILVLLSPFRLFINVKSSYCLREAYTTKQKTPKNVALGK